jgi:hypothetical protein
MQRAGQGRVIACRDSNNEMIKKEPIWFTAGP